jgi:hypothetical protein
VIDSNLNAAELSFYFQRPARNAGYGISLGVSQNRPFPKELIMPTNKKHGGQNERN